MTTTWCSLRSRRWTLSLVLTLALVDAVYAQVQMSPEAVAGLDQIPFAVADLEQATSLWRALGFSIIVGRVQDNGLASNQIKFEDGSGIALITAPAAVDQITTYYRQMIELGGGPAWFGLHARDMERLKSTLQKARYKALEDTSRLTLDSRYLDYLYFLNDNRVPTDAPYFVHPNGSYAMVRVWVATSRSKEIADLLVTLGGETTSRVVYVPDKANARVVTVNNGEVVILPKAQQLTENMEVVGATLLVPDIAQLERRLTIARIPFIKGGSANRSVIVGPHVTQGMWLEFQE